jgi:hypothetical protein
MNEDIDVSVPHGVDQNIKMDILGMIHLAQNPFEIIYHIAKYLEETSSEAGYADIVKDNIQSVYGLALGNKTLLQDELQEVIERGKRIKEAYDTGDFSDEEKKRIEFAVVLHRKHAEHLKAQIHMKEIEKTENH